MKKICLVFLVSLLPISLLAKVTIDKNVKYYYIAPKSKKDINKELLSKSPVKIAGKKRYGGTDWIVYTSHETKGACRITKAYVDLVITTTLPELNPKKSIKFSVKNPFKKFQNKLISYEKTHQEYAVKAAKEVERKMLSYGSPKDCDAFRKKIRKDINEIIKKYKRKSVNYHKKTDFGRKKGVKI